MGVPRLEPADVPFTAAARADRYTLTLEQGAPLEIGVVGMGNPHAVLAVADVDRAPVETLGMALQSPTAFPESVNVGFFEFIVPSRARLRVSERGGVGRE